MSNFTDFNKVSENPKFSEEEEIILKYWKEIDAFKTQLELTKHKKPFTFYDGPPFATGLPHYGHILAGTIKDVVCRYASQTGHYVERRFGWDCHGLPVEFEIDKLHKITSRKQVLDMGIDKYNELCKGIVMKYSKEWEQVVNRSGRWIDFQNDYKTMNPDFMESIWAVFKILFDKGYVYRGCKIMPYSNACNTVLSNFEVQQNYNETIDPAICVTFPLVNDPKVSFVAWTTTPWTLPSNLILAVNQNYEYVKVQEKAEPNNVYIVGKVRLCELYKTEEEYTIIETFKGKDLEGTPYTPLFDYFESFRETGAFKVYCADYVTDSSGTGIVHCAPGFGDDDYQVCLKNGIINADNPPVPLNENGLFTEKISDYAGIYVRDADKQIIKDLKTRNRLIKNGQIKHNYPFCWRSDTPLIYKAVHCWFIRVTAVREDLLKNNMKSTWVPKFVQEGRFNNWLEEAKDWCFSRNRFWGNPIPIWSSDDGEEIVPIGSIQQLKELSGYEGEITDLHREYIDKITIPSKKGKGLLKRIDEVFDCWFESGAMPYGQCHWPFSITEEEFSKRFPADFIGEGLDQTRGWFYTLNVISTMIRNDTPYKNLIVNGLVLSASGKKLSKRDQNYTPPEKTMKEYGADAVRLYLVNSPLVKASPLNFQDKGLTDTVKNVFLPWYNAYRLLIQNVIRWENTNQKKFWFDEGLVKDKKNLENPMDLWITVANMNLIKFVREEMENYRLYTVVPRLLEFLEQMTNWFIRLNRPRFKGDRGENESFVALTVLLNILHKITILMSPLVPFITDMIHQNLVKLFTKDSVYNQKSIHFIDMPDVDLALVDEKYERYVRKMQDIIAISRRLRLENKLSLKQPIQSLKIVSNDQEWFDNAQTLLEYIREEINTPDILFDINIAKYSIGNIEPNHQLGKKLGKKYQSLLKEIKSFGEKEANQLLTDKFIEVQGEKLVLDEDVSIVSSYKAVGLENYELMIGEKDFVVILDKRQNEGLKLKGIAREFTNRVQKLRKDCSLQPHDEILIFVNPKTNGLKTALKSEEQTIASTLKKPLFPMEQRQEHLQVYEKAEQNYKFDDEEFDIAICHMHVQLSPDFKANQAPEKYLAALKSLTFAQFKEQAEKNDGKVKVDQLELELNKDFKLEWSG